MKFLGHASIGLAAVMYAFFGVLARFVGFSIPLFYQNVTRNVFAVIILGAIMLLSKKREWKHMSAYAWKIVILRALMGTASFLLFFYTMNHMHIGMAYFLYYGTNTVIGYLLGRLLFQERITRMKWVAFILAFVGMASTYALNFMDISPLLFAAAIISGGLCAGWFVIIKKLDTYSGKQLTLIDMALPIVIYSIASLIMQEQWTMPELSPIWIASLSYGALFIITGQLVIYGYHRVEAQVGSLILLIEIPIANILAHLFYQEPISLQTTLGGILILTAMILPHFEKRKSLHI